MRHAHVLVGVLSLVLAFSPAKAQSTTADAAADAARAAARTDQHEAAIANFRQAMAAAPERRREWLLELADQLTWAERLDEAITLYREGALAANTDEGRRARLGLARALSWNGDHAGAIAEYQGLLARDAGDRDAGLGLAQVLSWDNRHGAATLQYEAVLRDHPGDHDALRGLARVESWRGRHRDAAARMIEFLQQRPNDREATIILAESLAWMGRPDRAARVLREHLAADPGHARAAALLAAIEDELRPEASVDWREFERSDDLAISEAALAARFPLADGRGYFGPRYSYARYRPGRGPVEEIEVQRPGLEAQYRISDALDWHGAAFVDSIETHGAEGDHSVGTFETYFTYWPNDLVRFDVGASRWAFDSEEALRAGLTATEGGASVDISPDDRTRLSLRASWADYSDGNERTWWQFQAERRILRQPWVAIGYRYTGFDFQSHGQPGYYNPDLYHSNEVLLQASGDFSDLVHWRVSTALGYETEEGGESRAIGNGGVSLIWKARPKLDLEFAYDYSSSSTSSTSGFERGIARITLRRRF